MENELEALIQERAYVLNMYSRGDTSEMSKKQMDDLITILTWEINKIRRNK